MLADIVLIQNRTFLGHAISNQLSAKDYKNKLLADC